MATIRERLIYAIDVVGDGARRGLGDIKTSIAEADGAVGKFKAGASSAMASIGVSAGTLAAVGGAALVGFSAKAIAAGQETALGAGKMADATGLTVEQASRLNEVSSDLGISGETITSVVKKMAVEIGKGNPLLDQYGIALQHAADGSADINATLLDTISRIGAIEDPTKRAAAAQAAFGRGYAEAAELIFTNADQLKQKLDDVSGAKVITEEELARAREFRDNLEDLKDVSEDLFNTLANVGIPVINDVTDGIKGWFDAVGDAGVSLRSFLEGGPITTPLQQFEESEKTARDFNRALLDGLTTFDQVHAKVLQQTGDLDAANIVATEFANTHKNKLTPALGETGDAAADAGDAVADLGDKAANSGPKIGDMAGALDDAAQHLADLNQEARDEALSRLANAVQGVTDAIDNAFSQFEDNLDIQDLLDDITEQFGKVAEAQKKMTEDGDQGVRNYNRSVRDLRRMIRDLLEDIKGIPPDKKVELLTEIQSGSLDDLYRILGELTKGVTVPVSFATAANPGFSGANVDFNPAAGTIAPVINNPTQSAIPSGYIDQRTQTFVFPVGTTPTTQYQMGILDRQRNGERTSL